MGLILWLIFGALVGWIASKFAGTDSQQGWVLNILFGIGGAVVGGLLWSVIDDDADVVAWTVQGFILSLIGAVILSLGFAYLTKRRV
jgi:uncharacterized membrane protein YeaQ/YmgE (transglycosylase-associated protein family)